jgi:choline dehydrogenase-like flavoprotein
MSLDTTQTTSTRTLRALCDTLVPAVGGGAGRARELLARPASELGIADLVAAGAPVRLLDRLAATGFADDDLDGRTATLRALDGDPGLRALRATVLALFYATLDDDDRNPNWPAIGYPGPISAPPPADIPAPLAPLAISVAGATLEADIVVVGSGAGGAVLAAEAAAAGRSVVILERGPYRREPDFRQLELPAAEMYLNGGLFFAQDATLGLLAGSTLGGGTTINSMVSLRTRNEVRAQWAADGLDALDGADYDAHLDAVCARLNVNTEHSVPSRNSQRLVAGLEASGRPWEPLPRNCTPDDDPRFCGYCHFGCQQGCKRSTLRTYLEDAAAGGARIVVDCRADAILTRDGRATGVAATVAHPDGTTTALEVRAPTVVVAAGGLESPALLLRSGIGGPNVGRFLRVHPTWFVAGVYDDPIEAWSGQVQSVVAFDRVREVEGSGWLVETTTLAPGGWASLIPWVSGRDHKLRMLDLAHTAPWHAVGHDHGSGRVTIDGRGEPRVAWRLDDPVDERIGRFGCADIARLHLAAGARAVHTLHHGELAWRRGQDAEAFLAAAEATRPAMPYSAHQMGSCRLGGDPATSVADPDGRLRDVHGVWIGDASALPTAPGVNPMITIMAMARRTAHRLLAA